MNATGLRYTEIKLVQPKDSNLCGNLECGADAPTPIHYCINLVDRPGIEPGIEACKATVFPSIPTAQNVVEYTGLRSYRQGAPLDSISSTLLIPRYRFLRDQLSFSRTHWLVSYRRV